MNKLIIDMQGEPSHADSPCTSEGYGYHAYCSTHNDFFHNVMRELSIWSGATAHYYTIEAESYLHYELDCRDKKFLKSETFKKICQHCDVELIICEDDLDPLRQFWDSIRR